MSGANDAVCPARAAEPGRPFSFRRSGGGSAGRRIRGNSVGSGFLPGARFGRREFGHVLGGPVDGAEVRLGMGDGGLDQEANDRVGFMLGTQLRERAQLVGVGLSLGRDHPLERAASEAGGGGELEEEVVAVSGLANEWCLEPRVELAATGVCQAVDDPIGPSRLADATSRDQPLSGEPVEHLVEVADREVAPLRPDRLLELLAQLVAVALTIGEQGEDGVLNWHQLLPIVARYTLPHDMGGIMTATPPARNGRPRLRHRFGRLAALALAALVAAAAFAVVTGSARSASIASAKQKVRCVSGVGLGRREYACKTRMRLVCHKSPGQTVLQRIPSSAYLGIWHIEFVPHHRWGAAGPPVAGGRLSIRTPPGIRREEAIVTLLAGGPPGMDVVISTRCS